MVVVDTLTPAPFQDGYLSGVLWKFATDNMTAPMGKLGTNFIDLFNFENVRRRINKRAASHTVGQCSNDHYDQCPVDAPSGLSVDNRCSRCSWWPNKYFDIEGFQRFK